MSWAFAIGSWKSNPAYAVTTARARRLAFRLDAPAECSFTLDGRSLDAGFLRVLESDVWVYRHGVHVFRGRIVDAPEELNEDRHTIAVVATDYRGMLNRRFLQAAVSYAAIDQALIAAALIVHTQAQPGGDLGITVPSLPTTVPRDRAYIRGDNIGQRIEELGRVEGGFDWWIGPDRALHVEYPSRGSVTAHVLDYGGAIATVKREADAGGFANQVTVTGGQGTTAVAAAAVDVATDPRGRWEGTFSYPSIVEQATMTARANRLLADGTKPPVRYRVTLAPGAYDAMPMSVGDTVSIRLESGQRNEVVPARIEELTVSLDDSGHETVELSAVAQSVGLTRDAMPDAFAAMTGEP